jgi:hypothetical protein
VIKCITWDWKDQPPLGKILNAAQEILAEAGTFCSVEPDTGGDFYAIILSDRELSGDEIEQALTSEV